MVVSNASSKKRLDFFEELDKVRHVDMGGGSEITLGSR